MASPPLLRRTLFAAMLLPGMGAQTGARAAELPERILVFGDSQAQGLAAATIRLYRGDRLRRVVDKSKIATGLLPRPNFDWPLEAEALASSEKAALAIAMFGANDRPSIRLQGAVDADLLEQFTLSYGDSVASIARGFQNANLPLVWVGHPIVRDPTMNEDMALLDTIYADRATAEGATYLPTWDLFRDASGQFAAYGKGVDGQTTKLRADDGIHMTPAGYDLVARLVAPAIDKRQPGAAPA